MPNSNEVLVIAFKVDASHVKYKMLHNFFLNNG